ncbi:UvrD-helicase domain-containing protein [Pediococcus damnosus]|nr:UvrD-helicase domain-containing protein [Pediococcus damnosus]KRN51684.1 hypothetical protein IV84_GL000927 [Pediococcus damnosus]
MSNQKKYKNVKIIDAPAGSGKTFSIRSQINQYLIKNNKSQVLCITFTNRAMKELKKNIISNRVYISTIHSFINDFISPLFKNESIINYYLKEYGEKIRKNISNVKGTRKM